MTDPLALATMVAHCGWDPTELVIDRTVLLDGNGTRMLTLPSLHVTGVSSITITDRSDMVFYPTIGSGSGEVRWSKNGCLLYRSLVNGGVFPEDLGNVAVTYSGGYDEVPADLQAALDSVGKRSKNASSGLRSKTMGSTSLSYFASGDLLAVEKMVFNRYRILDAH